MISPGTGLVALARWLQQLTYADLRNAEAVQTASVIGKRGRRTQLRGALVAPDLCLSRDRQFYKIIDSRAFVLPLHLVAEQYSVTDIVAGYRAARQRQPKSGLVRR